MRGIFMVTTLNLTKSTHQITQNNQGYVVSISERPDVGFTLTVCLVIEENNLEEHIISAVVDDNLEFVAYQFYSHNVPTDCGDLEYKEYITPLEFSKFLIKKYWME
jgi:hypothetical protein